MKLGRFDTIALVAATVGVVLSAARCAEAQSAATIDEAAAPGENYDKAEFRLWYPKDVERLQAVAVLVPGSNGDGRSAVDDPIWQGFAARNKLALVGCRFTDRPHDQSFIEQYVNVSRGSGQALLDALGRLAARTAHPRAPPRAA